MKLLLTGVLMLGCVAAVGVATAAVDHRGEGKTVYAQWENGPPSGADYFPIAVWTQSPRNAERYKKIGINIYYGLWGGPTEEQLAALKKAGMRTICAQNAVGLKHRNDATIIAWMHGDEPDNMKQVDGKWVPVAKPEEIIRDYKRMKKADPTRPVLLNLGQGVANDGYKGSWVRDHDTYVEFLKGCDISSYDIYPAVSQRPEVKGKLHLVAKGVDRLQTWTGGKKPAWFIVECTRISNPNRKPTPQEVRAEVWMALVHGARGICYFVHQFQPKAIEAGLLADEEMTRAVGEINAEIHALAPVLNSPTVADAVKVISENSDVPIDTMVKRVRGQTFLFAVAMRDGKTRAGFKLRRVGDTTAEVIGEKRTVEVKGGKFVDEFEPWDVHLYRIKE